MPDLKWVMDKVAVENEPGLSNAQLMLTNSDLRPGENKPFSTIKRSRLTFLRCTVDPERRQWRWPNYIAFWIADSLNIVSTSKHYILQLRK